MLTEFFIACGAIPFVPNPDGYPANQIVYFGDSLYISNANSNTTIPGQSGSSWTSTTIIDMMTKVYNSGIFHT